MWQQTPVCQQGAIIALHWRPSTLPVLHEDCYGVTLAKTHWQEIMCNLATKNESEIQRWAFNSHEWNRCSQEFLFNLRFQLFPIDASTIYNLLTNKKYCENHLIAVIFNLLESPLLSLVVEHHSLGASLNCPANKETSLNCPANKPKSLNGPANKEKSLNCLANKEISFKLEV